VGGSRIFGDLDDPNSEISILLRKTSHRVLKKAIGTGPNVYYINQYPTRS
jgi:Fe-S-cluster-containing dehydrogenase component